MGCLNPATHQCIINSPTQLGDSETLGLDYRHKMNVNEELFYIGCIKLSSTSYLGPYIIVKHSLVDCHLPASTFNYLKCVS